MIELIERPRNALPVYIPFATGPGGEKVVIGPTIAASCVHVFPPSVDLQMPRPASESPEAFASPVPACSVLLGASYVKVPIAFVPKLSETKVQLAPLPERALSVLQTPPPAAPTQTRQRRLLQLGSIASAVTRPEVKY